jgi:hypothetical protein
MNQSWSDTLRWINRFGFKTIYQCRYAYEDIFPAQIIAAHPTKYLLLVARSFVLAGREDLNDGHIYGTAKCATSLNEGWTQPFIGSGGFSHGARDPEHIVEFEIDMSTSPRFHLSEIGKNFQFVKWENTHRFLYLTNLALKKLPVEQWQQITEIFLASFPEWVKDFIYNS